MISNTWHKIVDLQEPRYDTHGAAGYGKIFIAGGCIDNVYLESFQVYHEATNEWQIIGTSKWPSDWFSGLLIVKSKLYLVYSSVFRYRHEKDGVIACCDLDRNEWEKTTPPLEMIRKPWTAIRLGAICYSTRVYKEYLDFFQNVTTDEEAKRERETKRNTNAPSCDLVHVYLFCLYIYYYLTVMISTN